MQIRLMPRMVMFALTVLMLLVVQRGQAVQQLRVPAALTPRAYMPVILDNTPLRLAVIGDYGTGGQPSRDVAALVKSWAPDAVLTTGDNNYPVGAASTIDQNVGAVYHEFIAPYTGQYGAGASVNRFFPTLGNHDWDTPNAQPYLDYFTLPGNERYYTTTIDDVQIFALSSDPREPHGTTAASTQGQWLQSALAASESCWNIVTMHHPPYSSAAHGSNAFMQWPYAAWGADLVLAGHDHVYERIVRDDMVYIVDGAGGHTLYPFGTPVMGSVVRYNAEHGAVRIDIDGGSLDLMFINRSGTIIDTYSMEKTCP